MPIKTDLNVAPFFDDYNIEKQFHRVLFKPSFAVQARELTQLQTILQNQIEQFGSNVYQEGSIIKGCTITQLDRIRFVKVKDKFGFDIANFVGGVEEEFDVIYELVGQQSGLRAQVVAAIRGFETRAPNLNTFYFNYLNTGTAEVKRFILGEELSIVKNVYEGSVFRNDLSGEVETIEITNNPITGFNENSENLAHEGVAYGLNISEGIVFQKGHFLFAPDQTIIISKYNNSPDNISVGYRVNESIVTALQDESLFDNANGFANENAPGADRLKLSPELVALASNSSEVNDPSFFSLIVYENGNPVLIRNVSQFNSIAEEMARRTFEESGNYIAKEFNVKIASKEGQINATVGPGVAYVRGYRIENSGERVFAIEPIAETSTDTRNNQAISVDFGRYLQITDLSGTVSINDYSSRVNLRDSGNQTIGTAIVKNIYEDRLYLFDVRMNDANTLFSDVTNVAGTSGSIDVTPRFQGVGNPTLVFDTGSLSLRSMSDINIVERRLEAGVTAVSNDITLSADVDEDFACVNDDIIVIDSTNTRITVSSIDVTLDFKTLTITLSSAPAGTCSVYFNIRLIGVAPQFKQSKTVYVKNTFSTSSTKYSLGLPDVYELLEVKVGSEDYTNSFKLVSNQRDNFYDISYIEALPGRPLPANGNIMTIKMNVFERQTSVGYPFFTVNSYNNVTGDKIPTFESSDGRLFNLRNCVDFRPVRTPLVTYETLVGSAPTVSAVYDVTPSFAVEEYIIPSERNPIVADVEFYLKRTDVITVDSYGKFAVIKGKESLLPAAPIVGSDKLVIAEIFVPSNTLVSPTDVIDGSKNNYIPRVTSKGVKAYKMSDIESLAKQIKRLMYYTAVSLLESSTQRLNVLDENGLPRFKNGIIVDPFNDLSIADVQNTDFNSAVDFTEKTLLPSVVTIPMNLKAAVPSDASLYPTNLEEKEVATLESANSSVILIRQGNATNFRSCTSNKYNHSGTGFVHPEYDSAYNTVTTPIVVDLDLVTPFVQLTDALQEFVPLTRVSESNLLNSTSVTSTATNTWTNGGNWNGTTTTSTTVTTNTIEDVIRSFQLIETSRSQSVGDFVTNVEFLPYMRSREINVLMFGLRPNTRHYAYFDKEDVNLSVAPGTFVSDPNSPQDIRIGGVYGDPLIADSQGIIRCVFKIPVDRFLVGERDFELIDVDTYAAKDTASSSRGFVRYNAYNFSIDKSNLTIGTRSATPTIQETRTERTVENRAVTVVTIRENVSENSDPIAQTFFIKEGMGRGSDTVFLSKIDVFFKRKSATNGVTVEIREVVNGYPAWNVLPFARKHLTSAEVNVSDDSSLATTFTFSAPVRLNTETEYCFVVLPDADDPEYLIFITKPGAIDLITGDPINTDWGDGVLFASTNNRTWKSYQDEDIKFTLYRHDFSTDVANVDLVLDDPEIFTLSNVVGRFGQGETVYAVKGSDLVVSVNEDVLTASSSVASTYSEGDKILLTQGSNTEIVTVASVLTNSLTIETPSIISGSANATPVVTATIQYYNLRRPDFMYLESSSARAERLFEANNEIIGYDSDSTAIISSVDNIELSYTQAMIGRTNDSVTKTELSGTFTDANGVSYEKPLEFAAYNMFNNRGGYVYSKSNNLLLTPQKDFKLTISMDNALNSTSSPFVDVGTSSLLAYRYNITNTSATTSKYVSKAIELLEDFDAEDFILYMTAYRPAGSDVKVYIKAQNKADPVEFRNAEWIELEMKEGVNTFSSVNNLNDIREFVYVLPEINKVNGVYTYANENGIFEGYRKFAIKIEMLSENITNVPRVFDYRGIAIT
jgi:hypothetical protein